MTPLERAARALCELEGRDPDEVVGTEGAEYPFWHVRRGAVRAVLTAIREPSEGMMKPGTLFSHFYHDADGLEDNAYFESGEAKRCWQAMIDALLAEEEEEEEE